LFSHAICHDNNQLTRSGHDYFLCEAVRRMQGPNISRNGILTRMSQVTLKEVGPIVRSSTHPADEPLHLAWRAFIKYCAELGFGEIEILKVQDGLPVFAEVTKKKVKFVP